MIFILYVNNEELFTEYYSNINNFYEKLLINSNKFIVKINYK